MPKGQKRLRGVPQLHDELKQQTNLSLTQTAVKGLDTLAQARGLSRSELVERLGRQVLPIGETASVPMSERQGLPKRAVIFLVMKGECILYVGQSHNAKANLKWLTNPRLQKLADEGNARIVWLECSEPKLLPRLKKGLIQALKPALAGTVGRPKKESVAEL